MRGADQDVALESWQKIFRSLVFMDCWLSYTLGYMSEVKSEDIAVGIFTLPSYVVLTGPARLHQLPCRHNHSGRHHPFAVQQDRHNSGRDLEYTGISRTCDSRKHRKAGTEARGLARGSA
jgi:hypothetical protein